MQVVRVTCAYLTRSEMRSSQLGRRRAIEIAAERSPAMLGAGVSYRGEALAARQ